MSNVISFADLIPARLRVTDLPGGVSLELYHRDELGPEELAAVQALSVRSKGLQEALKAEDDVDAALKVTMQINDVAGDMLRILSPNLTDEMLAGLKMGQRSLVLQWWSEQMPQAPEQNGNAPKATARPSRSSKRRG